MYKRKINNLLISIKTNGIYSTIKHYCRILYINLVSYIVRKRLKNEWLPLKDKYKGKRVFLIGNGPSLNETPLYLLKNEYTMCFNRINIMFERLNWAPTFYCCVDDLVAQNISQDINQEIVPKTRYAFFPLIHQRGTDFRKFILKKDNVLWLYQKSEDGKINIPKTTMGPTVAYPALEILIYMGFSEIFIIGMDMNYKIHNTVKKLSGLDIESKYNDDPNHFDPRYFGKGRQYHQPVESKVVEMLESMERANLKASKTNSMIFNATYGGKVEAFKRIHFESLFSFSDTIKLKLFAESLGLEISSKEELLDRFPLKNSIDEIADCVHFSLKKEITITKYIELIVDYIPFGPFEDIYCFRKREESLILK